MKKEFAGNHYNSDVDVSGTVEKFVISFYTSMSQSLQHPYEKCVDMIILKNQL